MAESEQGVNPPEPEASAETPEAGEAALPAGTAEPPPEVGELHREAARHRRKLREVERERDGLRQEIERLHRAEVERLAVAERMVSPADFWSVGPGLEELRDDAGRLDAAKVSEAIKGVLADRPHWRQSARERGPYGDLRPPEERKPGLADLLKP